MRILLIGAAGQLGSDLIRNNPGHEIIAPTRTQLNIVDHLSIETAIKGSEADLVINTAAFHNVPMCEERVEEAFRTNCVAVRDLALACKAQNIRLVTFSTDYVFDGTQRTPYQEDDCPRPLQIYGITKAAGETIARAIAPDHSLIIRTCGLYGQTGASSKGGNFVDKCVNYSLAGSDIEISCEQTVGPTSTHDLSKAIYQLIENPSPNSGIYHLVNEGECTWFEFTKTIYEILEIKTKVHPADRGGRTGTMRRPLYSVLANTRAREIGVTLPVWRNALKRYLQAKYQKLESLGRTS